MNLTVSHLERIRLPLLHKLYKEHYPAGKPKGNETILTLEENNKMIGAIRLKNYPDILFLTGMVIKKEKRNNGYASFFLQKIIKNFIKKDCYCFCSDSLITLYIKNGFQLIESKDTPNNVQIKYERYIKSKNSLNILIYKIRF